MNLEATYNKLVQRIGHIYVNMSTLETLLGAPREGKATIFQLSAAIEPSQIIFDPAEAKHYIVADVVTQDGHKLVFMYRAIHHAQLTRQMGNRDSFGLPKNQPVVVADPISTIIHPSQRKIQVPAGTQVKTGDLLTVGDSIYAVRQVQPSYDWPGLIDLMVSMQGFPAA